MWQNHNGNLQSFKKYIECRRLTYFMDSTSKRTILLAEDDFRIVMRAEEALEGHNDIKFIVKETREEALALIQAMGSSLFAAILDNNLKDASKCAVELALAALQAGIRIVAINSYDFDSADAPKGVEIWHKGSTNHHLRKLIQQ